MEPVTTIFMSIKDKGESRFRYNDSARLVQILMNYLLKTEPSTYSFADLQREGTTTWDGVTNPAAVKNLREMKPGDQLVIYHTGDEKRGVGTASVVSVDAKDPKSPRVQIKAGKAIS